MNYPVYLMTSTVTTPFAIIHEGVTPGHTSPEVVAQLQAWSEAGVTWWLEGVWQVKGLDGMLIRIKQGPSRVG